MPQFHADEYVKQINPIRDQFKKLYDERMPILNDYEDFAKTTLDTLIGETTPMARDIYRQAANYNTETSNFLKSAQEYDTPERRADARGKAMADVTSASEAARTNAISQLESFGIDPSQTRSASMDQNLRVQSALEAVRAAKSAEGEVETKGREYTAQALGLAGDAQGKLAQAGQTSAQILGNDVTQAGNVANLGINVGNAGQGMLDARMKSVLSSADLKQAEKASAQANKAGKTSGWAGIGQFVGTLGGAAVAGYASGGNPAAISAGAQAGGQLGGSAGNWSNENW